MATGDGNRPVHVPGDTPDAQELRGVLGEAGVVLDRGTGPADDSVVLVPVWGTTVAASVAEAGLPAARTLRVDPLSLPTRRRVLSMTPASDPDAVHDASAVLARPVGTGEPPAVSVVRDTAGSIAQRLLASVVTVAASIAERGIAAPADIDLAVTLGLGYPLGPLAWGEHTGAARMLDLHRALYATTGDPRYRPTRWVTERAQLGLPLTEPGTPPPHTAG